MPFCSKCGEKLDDRAKFCPSCGEKVAKSIQEETNQVKQENADKLIKCPACGIELSSFAAICPACGHEIHAKKVANSLKEFADAINECDKLIAIEPKKPKSGWSSWDKTKRTWWVILNIFTGCIPLVIYLVFPLLTYGKAPSLTAGEKRKASLIENFSFPNDRESILEVLLFAKSKTDFLVSEKLNRKTVYWSRLWTTKAKQLHQKADILLRGDQVATSAYNDVLENENKIKHAVKMKAILGGVILIGFILFICVMGHSSDNADTHKDMNLEWPNSGLCTVLPVPSSHKGEIGLELDESFDADLYQVTKKDYETYVKQCKDKGFVVDSKEQSDEYEAYNEEGYKLVLSYDDYNGKEISIRLEAPKVNGTFDWPTIGMAALIPKPESNVGTISIDSHSQLYVYVGKTSKADYYKYVNECIEKGFDVEYDKGDRFYSAMNKKGDSLRITYEGNDTMSISMYASDKEK